MKEWMMTGLVLGLVAMAIVGLGYVRLAPSDPSVWHEPDLPDVPVGEHSGTGRFSARYNFEGDGAAALARFHRVALDTPRTEVLAGDLQSGKITYVTRSRVIGFPDYTTVSLEPGLQTGQPSLQIYARLRFGLDDLGVNRARVRDWVRRSGLSTPES